MHSLNRGCRSPEHLGGGRVEARLTSLTATEVHEFQEWNGRLRDGASKRKVISVVRLLRSETSIHRVICILIQAIQGGKVIRKQRRDEKIEKQEDIGYERLAWKCSKQVFSYFFLISMSQKWNWRASRGRLFALMIYDNLQRKVHFTLNLLIFEDAC